MVEERNWKIFDLTDKPQYLYKDGVMASSSYIGPKPNLMDCLFDKAVAEKWVQCMQIKTWLNGEHVEFGVHVGEPPYVRAILGPTEGKTQWYPLHLA